MDIRFIGCSQTFLNFNGAPSLIDPPDSSLLRNSNQRRWFVERIEKTSEIIFQVQKSERLRSNEQWAELLDCHLLADVFVMQGVLVDTRRLAGAYIRTMVSRPLSHRYVREFFFPWFDPIVKLINFVVKII